MSDFLQLLVQKIEDDFTIFPLLPNRKTLNNKKKYIFKHDKKLFHFIFLLISLILSLILFVSPKKSKEKDFTISSLPPSQNKKNASNKKKNF